MNFVSAFSPKERVRLKVVGESRTKQQFKDECDINSILKKYNRKMGIDALEQYAGYFAGNFGDVSVVPSYQEAQTQMFEAQEAFAALPAKARAKFSNDPLEMLAFLSDVGNRDEAIALGLLEKPKADLGEPVSG